MSMDYEVAIAALKVEWKFVNTGKKLPSDWLLCENIAPSGGVVKLPETYNHKKKFQYRTHDVPVTNFK